MLAKSEPGGRLAVMRRTRRLSASIAMVSSWFALVMSAPGTMPLCPMHSMPSMAGHATHMADDMDDMMAAGDDASAQHRTPQDQAPARGHDCCVACCAVSRAILPAAAPAAFLAAVTRVFDEPSYPRAAEHRPAPREHARPPSLAPPALSA